MRNLVQRLRRRAPVPPHAFSPEEAARLGREPVDPAFVTGNGFAARCRHVLNYAGFTAKEDGLDDWYFCKTDYLDWFFARHGPRRPYVLVSHNSDRPVDELQRRRLDRRGAPEIWFAANVALDHPRLVPIPLGIANPGWAHGNPAALREAQAAREKTALFDVSFSLDTNRPERTRCLEQTGLELAARLPHQDYLKRLAAAYFCLSPSGNGIDTHRTWEALYLRTVPVVTRSALTLEWGDLPLVVLDDWADFGAVDFSPELYERLMDAWDPAALSMDAVVERMRRRVASAR